MLEFSICGVLNKVNLVAIVLFIFLLVKQSLIVTESLKILFPLKVWIPVVITPAALSVAAGIIAVEISGPETAVAELAPLLSNK